MSKFWHWCSPVHFVQNFRTPFPKNTSEQAASAFVKFNESLFALNEIYIFCNSTFIS